MTGKDFQELRATYEKFGWELRRVLVTDLERPLIEGVDPSLIAKTDGVPAAWFSRPGTAGVAAWELRSLGGARFAILEHLDESSPDFEEKIRDAEARLSAYVRQSNGA